LIFASHEVDFLFIELRAALNVERGIKGVFLFGQSFVPKHFSIEEGLQF
jgi:hypothetical protein